LEHDPIASLDLDFPAHDSSSPQSAYAHISGLFVNTLQRSVAIAASRADICRCFSWMSGPDGRKQDPGKDKEVGRPSMLNSRAATGMGGLAAVTAILLLTQLVSRLSFVIPA
jgi:hypothetical protein